MGYNFVTWQPFGANSSVMSKRDLLKGRVKRLLREQKDMGQVAESAVVCCTSAVQLLVRDLAQRMQGQAANSAYGLTPVELKKCVLASEELKFLHEKMETIDESAAKYHKPARGKKRPLRTDTKKPTKKKARAAPKRTATASSKPSKTEQARGQRIQSGDANSSEDGSMRAKAISPPSAAALEVEEDDDYDESDSD